MFENIAKFFKKLIKSEAKETIHSKDTAKERLHLVLMQDRANVSADFLELMKQEIIEVIKKYIEVEESAIDVRLTNEIGDDGTKGAPSLYANIPIVNIKNNIKQEKTETNNKETKTEKVEDKKIEKVEIENKKEVEKENNKNEEIKEEVKENKEDKKEDNKQEDAKEQEKQKNENKDKQKSENKKVEEKPKKESNKDINKKSDIKSNTTKKNK